MSISSSYFTYINIFIGIIYLIQIIVSYKKGLLYELLNLVLKVLSIYVSYKLSIYLCNVYSIVNIDIGNLKYVIDVNSICNHVLWFVICFLVLNLIISLIMPLFKSVSKVPLIGVVNKIGGMLVGILNATLTVLIISVILSLPIIKNGDEVKNNTFIKPIATISQDAYEYIAENTETKEFISEIELKALMKNTDLSEFEENKQVQDYLKKNGYSSIEDVDINELSLSQREELIKIFIENEKK